MLEFFAPAALKLLFGSALKKVGGLFGGLFKWIGSLDLVHLLLLAACVAFAVDHAALIIAHRHSAKVEGQLSKCTSDRATDRATYVKAQTEAAAQNVAHNAADKVARERITNDVSQGYEAQLASLRADLARRLRPPTASSAPGAAGVSGLPGVSPTPSGPDGAARVSIPSSLYVRGAELELEVERLQQWVTEQVKVDPNKAPAK